MKPTAQIGTDCHCNPKYRAHRFRDGKLETIDVDDPAAAMREPGHVAILDVLHDPGCPKAGGKGKP